MIHDELLAIVQNSYSGIPDFEGNWKANQALRAVVELHKPAQDYFGGDDIVCKACSSEDFEWIYPCPTIQAIEKELA